MNDLITINIPEVILLQEGKDITLTVQAKEELEKILYFKKLIEDIYEHVQDKLSLEFEKSGLKKVVAGNIVISKRFYGERYAILNKDEVDPEYTKVVEWVKPDGEKIDALIEKTGEMPKGISLKERTKKVSIIRREEE
jgi:hypothetical protein